MAPAAAQGTQLPGLIVTMPPAEPEAAPKAEPKPKPKPKPRAKRKAPKKSTRTARRSAPKGSGNGRKGRRKPHAIALLVNDDPITNYDIDARARLLSTSTNLNKRAKANFQAMIRNPRTNKRLKAILQETIKANQGKSRDAIIKAFERRKAAYARSLQKQAMSSARRSVLPGLRKKAEDELVQERLKLQEAKRLGIKVDDTRVNQIFSDLAKRNKMTPAQFKKHLIRMGASASAMKDRYRSQLAWQMVVNRRFRRLTSVSQRDIDQFLGSQQDEDAGTSARLHKITLQVPGNLDQAAIARRMSEADALRRQFRSCQNSGQLAARLPGAQFRDMGQVNVNKLQEPTRSMILSANDNQMLPPSLGRGGVELYAVCSKTAAKQSLEKRNKASRSIRQKEMNRLGQRHLANLRRDALIERR
ncbi:MAG: SurA N-terminal domain-containing protein [Pseudomonadota bacterium]